MIVVKKVHSYSMGRKYYAIQLAKDNIMQFIDCIMDKTHLVVHCIENNDTTECVGDRDFFYKIIFKSYMDDKIFPLTAEEGTWFLWGVDGENVCVCDGCYCNWVIICDDLFKDLYAIDGEHVYER